MSNLISRQAAIDAVRSYYDEFDISDKSIEQRIEALPSAHPATQEPTAEWKPSTKYKGFLTCSACEDCYIEAWSDKERKWRYCPQCGKRMGRFRK